MCLICGFVNFENSVEKSLNILEKLNYRGIDSKGIYFNNNLIISKDLKEFSKNLIDLKFKNESKNKLKNDSKLVLAHSLHSIVGFIPQPINKNKNILISNCEIYNWIELKKKFNLKSKNDSELILDLIEKNGYSKIKEIINLFEGVFAFCYYNKKDNKLVLARNMIGEKPLFYLNEKGRFAFCSEKKAIIEFGEVKELNPREILIYDIKNKSIEIIENKLEYSGKLLKDNYENLKINTFELLEKAILKMVPKDEKIGLLFSGGIDSTFIAYILKKNNIDFICYTAKLEGGNIKEAQDYIYASEISKKYNFKLKVSSVKIDKLKLEVIKIINLIEESEYIKVSVALPFLFSCEKAKLDGIKVIFSGLGSEELFAGYRRHKSVKDVNLECYKGLMELHSRDLYRDDVICMSKNIELRIPFLDKNLIDYSLKIPVKYKLDLINNRSKIILRDIAKDIGIDEKYAERQKKAAQYGSKFDKGLLRLAKNSGLGKQEYLNSLNKYSKTY